MEPRLPSGPRTENILPHYVVPAPQVLSSLDRSWDPPLQKGQSPESSAVVRFTTIKYVCVLVCACV